MKRARVCVRVLERPAQAGAGYGAGILDFLNLRQRQHLQTRGQHWQRPL